MFCQGVYIALDRIKSALEGFKSSSRRHPSWRLLCGEMSQMRTGACIMWVS